MIHSVTGSQRLVEFVLRKRYKLWDTNGLKACIHMIRPYYNQDAIVIVYDITDWDSFESAQWYYEDVVQYFRQRSRTRPIIILCGNKCDLGHMRKVPQKVAKEYANSNGVLYMECSARSGTNLFLKLDI
eukprot:TRINITY_DN3714_c0_g2_i1.p1 TRINITY_DN3714_c0_g2~~TRINITY_DN3714_c0_g2_i1.p1  ORF type:complete len:129 (-),score=3.37 TRINITY_DN3714_c0_g2_i1:380-766(-)